MWDLSALKPEKKPPRQGPRPKKLTAFVADRVQREQCHCGEPATMVRAKDRKPFCHRCALDLRRTELAGNREPDIATWHHGRVRRP